MNKIVYLRHKPFDEVDASQQNIWNENYFSNLLTSVINYGVVSGLITTFIDNMNVSISPGSAYDSNYTFINSLNAVTKILSVGSAANPRIDLISIKYNTITTNNVDSTNKYGYGTSYVYSQNILDSFTITVTQGIPAASPITPATPPGELALASILVPINATAILPGNITDLRLISQLKHLDANSISDVMIGARIIDDSIIAVNGSDNFTRLLSKLGNTIKNITGKTNWYTAPITTLELLNTAINTSQLPTTLNLGYDTQIVNTTKASPFNVINIYGCTRVNLLGRNGGFDNSPSLTQLGSNATSSWDTATYVQGTQSLKVTNPSTTINSGAFYLTNGVPFVQGNYYIFLVDVKVVSGSAGANMADNTAGYDTQTTSDTTKFNTLYIAKQWTPANATQKVDFYTLGFSSSAYFDAARVYQISQADYNLVIGGTLTTDQIAKKYAYVDDVKHINSPYINRLGENMLPSFNEYGSIHANATINAPYDLKHVSTVTSGESSYYDATLVIGQQYTFSFNGNGKAIIACIDSSFVVIGTRTIVSSGSSGTFTVPSGTSVVRFSYGNLSSYTDITNTATYTYAAGTYTFTNPRLNIGAVDKGVKPRNDDSLMFPNISLASNMDCTVYDQLYRQDGKWFRENRFVRDMMLDGSLAWTGNAVATGVHRVGVPLSGFKDNALIDTLVKYDGKVMVDKLQSGLVTGMQDIFYMWSNGTVYLDLSNTDTGWGDGYAPLAGEIQAYFYGWKMYDNVSPANAYSSGGKAWVKITNRNSVGVWSTGSGDSTNTLPTAFAGIDSNTRAYTPYKLTYQLAIPTFEEIAFEGSISTLEGGNQFEVGNGVIVREKANPSIAGANYAINYNSTPITNLKNRTNRILGVYRNGLRDYKWVVDTHVNYYGGQGVYIPIALYDTTATYEVTYLALDQYALTANVQTINGEYDSNIKMVVDRLSQNMSDAISKMSVVENLSKRIYSTPQQSMSDVALYVAKTGSDNGDGSATKPFLTIAKAVSMIPQICNHVFTINVGIGTYAEDLIINGFKGGGTLKLIGAGAALSDSYIVSSANVKFCDINIIVQGFKASTTGNAFTGALSSSVTYDFCKTDVSALSAYACRFDVCTASVSNCLFSNRYATIDAESNSRVYSNNNSGTGNTFGLAAHSNSTIGKLGTQSTATTPEIIDSGAMITGTSGVSNPWGDNTLANRSVSGRNHPAAQTLAATVLTKISFTGAVYDNLAETDASGKFTVKSAGIYSVGVHLGFTGSPATGNSIEMRAYSNGTYSGLIGTESFIGVSSPSIFGRIDIKLAAGDTIEIYCVSSVGVTTNTNGAVSLMTVTRIA